eukprot:9710929-Lingulodinium_polyedra.AAC.1
MECQMGMDAWTLMQTVSACVSNGICACAHASGPMVVTPSWPKTCECLEYLGHFQRGHDSL